MVLSDYSPSSNSHRPGEVWKRLQVTEERFLGYVSLFTDTVYLFFRRYICYSLCKPIFTSHISGKMWHTVWSWNSKITSFDSTMLNGWPINPLQCHFIPIVQKYFCLILFIKVFIRAAEPVVFVSLVSQTSSVFPDRHCCCPGKLSWKVSWGASVAWCFEFFGGIVGPSAS